jgi:hypothetical protein
MDRCTHGYRNLGDCPRCVPRLDTIVGPRPAHRRETRWRATATTLGPGTKIAITCALLFPVLFCLAGVAAAAHHLENTFFVVPLWLFGVIAAVGIHGVWERG